MTLVVTHGFVNSHADSTDATRTQPSHWNAAHSLSGAADLTQGGTGATTAPAAVTNLNLSSAVHALYGGI